MPSRTPLNLLLLAACTARNPAFDPTDPAGSASSGTTAHPTTAPGEPLTTTTATTIETIGDASAGETTTAIVPSTATTADITTTDITTTDITTTTDTGDDTTGAPQPAMQEHLQFYDPQACTTPLWCHAGSEDPFAGAPQRTASQLCVTPKSKPPYRIVRVGYIVARTFGDIEASESWLQFYTRGPDGPETKLDERLIGPGGLSWQPHAIVFADPIVIDSPSFCLGLIGGFTGGPGAGLGVAVDPTEQAPGRSYIRFSDGGQCEHNTWRDVDAIDPPPTPEGTWCIDVDVIGQP